MEDIKYFENKKVILKFLSFVILVMFLMPNFSYANSDIRETIEYDYRDGQYVKIIEYRDKSGKPVKPSKIISVPSKEGINKIGNKKELYKNPYGTMKNVPSHLAIEYEKENKEYQKDLNRRLELIRSGELKLDNKHLLGGKSGEKGGQVPEDRYDLFFYYGDDVLYKPIIDTGLVVRDGKVSRNSVKEMFHRMALAKDMDYIELEEKIILFKKNELAYIDLENRPEFELEELITFFYGHGIYLMVGESRIDKQAFMADYMETYQDLNVDINGEIVHYDTTKPVLENMDVIVPIRLTFEKLGANIDWNKVTRIVKVNYKNNSFKGLVDSNKANVNGKEKNMKYPVYLDEEHNKSLGELDFLSKNLGVESEWDAKENKLILK